MTTGYGLFHRNHHRKRSFASIAFLPAVIGLWCHDVFGAEAVLGLSIARISDQTIELRVGPTDAVSVPSPMLVDFPREEQWRGPAEEAPPTVDAGGFRVEIERSPLSITARRTDGTVVQRLAWQEDGNMAFNTDAPVFGLGENGARWDRRGAEYPMAPRWGSDTQGSVVPSPLLIGADGWALLLPQPDGSFDLRGDHGRFMAGKPTETLLCYLIAWKQPGDVLAEYVRLTGRPRMPPKWALGYMQSHRTLTGWDEVQQVAKTFREKKLPCDALIYLSDIYCKQGWGNGQTPFRWDVSSFPDPAANLATLHDLNFKVVLHVAKYPRQLHGQSVAETSDDPAHIANFWKQHASTYELGVDGWWPDDGDDLSREGRMARHRCYFEGPLTVRPDERPWSLHRTGVAGMARYGGWLWSGDTESRWATLAAQIPVGLGASLSISPFWGSDAGGFFPGKEYTGELFVRWFQFAAFTPSFRSHGRTWHLHLPWGWNNGEPGPIEGKEVCDASEFHNAEVEPACREMLDLRYRLLPYNYTLAREACDTGLPMMRALWLHHPDEAEMVKCKDAFLWGRDLLVAPVVKKGATTRKIRLPRGTWFDWWTGEAHEGGHEITRTVDLATLPLFARAGAIIPLDPVRQFTAEQVTEPTEIRVFAGSDGDFTLYDDDGRSMEYLKKDGARIHFRWNDSAGTLAIEPANGAATAVRRPFSVRIMPGAATRRIDYRGEKTTVHASSGG